MPLPLVSVIIPAYKAEKLITEALQSVQAQTYCNWEIIIVDDASEDGTEGVVQAFAQHVPEHRVHYVCHLQNLGVSAARNAAIALAQGEFLAFLDADDIWTEQHLEVAIAQLEASQADLAYSSVEMFDHGTRRPLMVIGPTTEEVEQFPSSFYARCFLQPSSVVMRKQIWQTLGCFDSQLTRAEDYDYWLRAVAAGYQFIYIPGIHTLYRKNTQFSLTNDYTKLLENHCLVLRRHSQLPLIPASIRKAAIAEYHLETARRLLSEAPFRAIEVFCWSVWLSPRTTVRELIQQWMYQRPSRLSVDFTTVLPELLGQGIG